MFGEIAPSPYDWRFTVLGIPVRVHPLFWLAALFFGFPSEKMPGNEKFGYLLVSAACLLASLLVHELGHALTARRFGWPPEIVIYHLGGYAAYNPTWGYTRLRAVLVLLAGPLAGFALYGLLVGATLPLFRAGWRPGPLAWRAISTLEWINLYWGAVNLLPVYPLDGGQIARHLLTGWMPRNGLRMSLQLSVVAAGAMALWMYSQYAYPFGAVLFGIMAFESFQALQRLRY